MIVLDEKRTILAVVFVYRCKENEEKVALLELAELAERSWKAVELGWSECLADAWGNEQFHPTSISPHCSKERLEEH
jgi:hypothetical protein